MKTLTTIALLLLIGLFVSCEREEHDISTSSILEHKYLYKGVLYSAKFKESKDRLILIEGKDNSKLTEIFSIPTLNVTMISSQDSVFYLFDSLKEADKYFASAPINITDVASTEKKSARTASGSPYFTVWVDPWYSGGGLDLIPYPGSTPTSEVHKGRLPDGLNNRITSVDAFNHLESGTTHLYITLGDEAEVDVGRTFSVWLGPQVSLYGINRYVDLRNYRLCDLCFGTWNDRISSWSWYWRNYGPRIER